MKPILLAIVVASVSATGLNASAQAIGEAIQINRQSMQNMGAAPRIHLSVNPGTAGGDTQDQMMVHDAEAQYPLPDCQCAQPPSVTLISVDPHEGTRFTITSTSHDAAIYYTTDGWTPTPNSPRYTVPITVHAETRLQAIAFEPQKTPSAIVTTNIPVTGTLVPRPQVVLAFGAVLRKATPIRLVTHGDTTSDFAQVGDRLPLLLDENIVDGTTILVPRGTAVEATITRADPARSNGRPGVLAFQVKSLTANGVTIPLEANLTLAAPDLATVDQKVSNASLVHVARALPRGQECEIVLGMPLTAYVTADTSLHP